MKPKSNKQISMEAIPGEWKRLDENGVLEFQNILRILNRYYDAFSSDKDKTETQKFREEASLIQPEKLEFFVKKFGNYEYLIYSEIKENGEKVRSDTWIHIDGIGEERDLFTSKDILTHPVHNILCMRDLYKDSKALTEEREMIL
jgi:hypothetical protein